MASYDSYQGDYGSSNYGGGGYRDSGGGMGGGGGGFGGGGYGGAGYGGAGYGGAGYGGATPFGGAGATPPVVRGLLILNVVVFLLQLIVGKFTSFDYMKYFALNSEYAIGRLWIWQFFTSIFLHSPTGIFHILFNMLMLWMFGREVEARLGSKRFLQFYLGAGAFASLCFAIVAVLGAKFALAVGASGAIFGVMVLFAYLYPEATLLAFFVIPVKAKHLVMFLIAMDLVYFVFMSDSSQVAHSAHLGGALFGFLYWRYEPRFRLFMQNLEARERRKAQEGERDARARVDRLLDKIQAGESITPKERKFLDEASKKYYQKRPR